MRRLEKIRQYFSILFENVLISYHSIKTNKTRAFLSILGILIGIAAVITVTSLGQAFRAQQMKWFANYGTNKIELYAHTWGDPKKWYLIDKYFTENMAAILQANISHIIDIAFERQLPAQASYENNKFNCTLEAVKPNYLLHNNQTLKIGRFLWQKDRGMQNIVLASKVAAELFPEMKPEDMLGKYVILFVNGKSLSFNVTGILVEKENRRLDNKVFIDITAFNNLIENKKSFETCFIVVDQPENVSYVIKMVDLILKKMAGLKNDISKRETFYYIHSQKEMLESYDDFFKKITLFIAGIAAISLLVGGIGIMNIMLVSVTERTREIGIRKAIGAKNSSIFTQFLVESVLITLLGCVLGLIIGIIATFFLVKVFQYSFTINIPYVIVSLIFSVLIGNFFGLYPAQKAARLKPVEALKYE